MEPISAVIYSDDFMRGDPGIWTYVPCLSLFIYFTKIIQKTKKYNKWCLRYDMTKKILKDPLLLQKVSKTITSNLRNVV